MDMDQSMRDSSFLISLQGNVQFSAEADTETETDFVKWQSSQPACPALEALMVEAARPVRRTRTSIPSSMSWEASPVSSSLNVTRTISPAGTSTTTGARSQPSLRPRSRRRPTRMSQDPPSSGASTPSISESDITLLPPRPLPSPGKFLDLIKCVSERVDTRIKLDSRAALHERTRSVGSVRMSDKGKRPSREGEVATMEVDSPMSITDNPSSAPVTPVESPLTAGRGLSSKRHRLCDASSSSTTQFSQSTHFSHSTQRFSSQTSVASTQTNDTSPPQQAKRRAPLARSPSQVAMPPPPVPVPLVKRPSVSRPQASVTRIAATVPVATGKTTAAARSTAKSTPVATSSAPTTAHARRVVPPPLPPPPQQQRQQQQQTQDLTPKATQGHSSQPERLTRPPALGMRRAHTVPAPSTSTSTSTDKGFKPPLKQPAPPEPSPPRRGSSSPSSSRSSPAPEADSSYGELSFDLDALEEVMRQYD